MSADRPMSDDALIIRDAERDDVDELAALWHAGWRDAHLGIVPPALVELRTLENFADRLRDALADVRVAGPPQRLAGFYQLRDDELYQFYVAAASRGTGVAAALMRDAEARLAVRGVAVAWLSCAVGNHRAARFYEKAGWRRTATLIEPTVTSRGPFPVEVWRFEKGLR